MPRSTATTPTPSNPRSTRAAWFGLVALGLPLLANIACTSVRYTEAFEPEGEVTRVIVHSDAGLVEVVSGDELRVERAIRAPEAALRLSHDIVDGILMIEAHCTTVLPCAVDTRVTIPHAVPVEIDLGVGEVWATGVTDLQLELDEGSADVDITGKLVASVGSGSIRARVADEQRARVGVGRGDIHVEVPTKSEWRVDAHTGKVELIDLDSVADAVGVLDLTAPAGTITVRRSGGFASR